MNPVHGSGRVSVIIAHYGNPDPATRLVAALGGDPAVYETIVVDDASPQPFPDNAGATVLRRTVNGGYGAAMNSGARTAHAELILLLNSDVTPPPDFVSALVKASEPWQPALTGPAVITANTREQTGRRFPKARHQALEGVRAVSRWRHHPGWAIGVGLDPRSDSDEDTAVDWIAGVAMLIPRELFLDVGGFDERFYMYAEEVDLQRRLALLGIPRVLLGSARVEHVGAASSDPMKTQDWLMSSRLAYARKWGGASRLRLALTATALVNSTTDSVRRAAGRDTTPLRDLRTDIKRLWS